MNEGQLIGFTPVAYHGTVRTMDLYLKSTLELTYDLIDWNCEEVSHNVEYFIRLLVYTYHHQTVQLSVNAFNSVSV